MGISIGVYVFFLSFCIGRVLFHGCVNVNMDILPVCVYIYMGKMNKRRCTAKPKLLRYNQFKLYHTKSAKTVIIVVLVKNVCPIRKGCRYIFLVFRFVLKFIVLSVKF